MNFVPVVLIIDVHSLAKVLHSLHFFSLQQHLSLPAPFVFLIYLFNATASLFVM